jgi:gluconate 2-dehydrogenase gamma chain
MKPPSSRITRRQLLKSSAAGLALSATLGAKAATIAGTPQWLAFDHNGSMHYVTPGWQFFSASEAQEIEAIVNRLIPEDELSVGGKDAGCAVFIDRQLVSGYGDFSRQYRAAPFIQGTPEQGDQSPLTPRQRYRLGLADLEQHCRAHYQTSFSKLPSGLQDAILKEIEKGLVEFRQLDAKLFFQQVLTNTMEGFFADPVYGGNRDMVSWKMLGFPGARYDYRDYIALHNQKLDLVPLSIYGGAAWQEGSVK